MGRERRSTYEKGESSSRTLRKRKFENDGNKEKSNRDIEYEKDRSRRNAAKRIEKAKESDEQYNHKRRRTGSRHHAESTAKAEETQREKMKESKRMGKISSSGKDRVRKGCTNKTDMKPNNRFGDVEVNKNETYYRSNLRTAIKEINSVRFKDFHFDAIKKTPLWFMFDAIYIRRFEKLMQKCHKNEDDIKKIVRTFDLDTGSFVIGGEYLELTSMDAMLIFGVSGGDTKIDVKAEGSRTPNWVKRYFSTEMNNRKIQFMLYKPHILDKIIETVERTDATSIDDMTRLVHCYLLAAFLCPNQNGSISSGLSEYAEDLTKICSYYWSRFIVDMIKSQLRKSVKMKAGRCAILLPISFQNYLLSQFRIII